MKILIIEDEAELRNEIKDFLVKEDYICESAIDYFEAHGKIALYIYDVILLDITLPHGNGLELLKFLKTDHTKTGVIIISARDSLDDKLHGLDLGADNYLVKPFHLAELNSRIKAVLRRQKFQGSSKIALNEITILADNKEVNIHGQAVVLTKKEYELLVFFITNKNRVLTKEIIAEHLWGDYIDMSDNFDFIYVHINNLRRKIKNAGGNDYIRTIYGMGYKFCDQ